MPILLKQNIDPLGELGIWQLSENIEELFDELFIYPEEKEEISQLKKRKRDEWIASRYLLHYLSGRKQRGAVIKDKYGKPFLLNSSYHISLSHSRDLTAVIASPILCGVDIQYIVPKIESISPKFATAAEQKQIDPMQSILYYHFIWGAKECLFKAYGKGNVDFKKL